MSTDYRYTNNKKPPSKKITLADIDPKYLPPKPIGPDGQEIPWSDDSIPWLMEYATNARQASTSRFRIARQL
jgi:hypothetical protein